MKYKPFPFSALKKLHLVDPGAFLHFFRRTWVFLIVVICTLMPVSSAIAQGWSVQTVTSSAIKSVYFVDATTGWAVGQNGIILKTIDGSATWTAQTSVTSSTLNSVYCFDASTCWAVGNNGTIVKTIDGGTTWSAQTVSYPDLKDVHFENANTGWAVGSDGSIFKTNDGGTTWTAQFSGTFANLNGVYFLDATTGWAVGNNGTIRSTINGGTNWAAQTSVTSSTLNSVYFVDANTGWAVGNNGTILMTLDGSTTWFALTSGTINNLNSIYFISITTGWAVGDGTTILHTADGGTTWTAQTSGAANDFNSVYFVSANTGWAVGNNGTILKYEGATLPAAPTNLVATPCGSQVEISFTAGADGGSPITNYQYSLDGTNWTTLSPAVTASPVTITSLTSGTYNISLRAVNSVGTGVSSTTVTATIDTNAAITVTYTGTTLATTTNKSANITLSATVTLPVGSNASQQAQLRFIDRGTGQDLSGWLSLTGTSNTGTVSHTAALTLGTYEIFRKYNIGIELGGAGCYTRNSPADNVTVTVAEPSCGCY